MFFRICSPQPISQVRYIMRAHAFLFPVRHQYRSGIQYLALTNRAGVDEMMRTYCWIRQQINITRKLMRNNYSITSGINIKL